MQKITWNLLCPPKVPTHRILAKILPEYMRTFNEEDLGSGSRKTATARSRFCTGASNKMFINNANYIISQSKIKETHFNYTYATFPLKEKILSNWSTLLDSLPKEDLNAFRQRIDLFINMSEDDSEIIRLIKNLPFAEKLTILSFIASTWTVWEQFFLSGQSNMTVRLANLIFPEGTLLNGYDISDELTDTEAATFEDSYDAESKKDLETAEEFFSDKDYERAGKLCEKIISRNPADEIRAKACLILGRCCGDLHYKVPDNYSSADAIFREAAFYGCSEAEEQVISTDIIETESLSVSDTKGTCIINQENDASFIISETIPDSWTLELSNAPYTKLQPYSLQRFALISDDYDKNIRDTLKILDSISKSGFEISAWHVEIYIRCVEETAAPVIDTALNFMEEQGEEKGRFVPVYIIDDAKRTAQLLYARHPLFYPLSFDYSRGKMRTLNLVIISDNQNSNMCEWLVREAFWALTTIRKNVNTRITVLSPSAEKTGWKINNHCPGLSDFSYFNDEKKDKNKREISINDISFSPIHYITVNTDTRALFNELDKLVSANTSFYFIVDGGSDLKSLNLAVQIREWNIRENIHSYRIKKYAGQRPVIAFYCSNPDYAKLSQKLLVQKNERRSDWFNDYGFITFGSLKERYSWNMLNGGIFETAAQCIHLKYSGINEENWDGYSGLDTYFNRIYNRDSSFSAAISLPYRLFEAGIIPKGWYIQDPNAYWCQEQRHYLSEKFSRKKLQDKDLIYKLSRYEHSRWCCYMLSRGWMPATADETVSYMNYRVPKHQLYIAKLHPCICSWSELKSLHKRLSAEYNGLNCDESGLKKVNHAFEKYYCTDDEYNYFTDADTKSIEGTSKILETAWFNNIRK